MANVESEAAALARSSPTESPTQAVPLTVKVVKGRRFPPIGIFKRQGRFFVQIAVDKNKKITATSARSNDPLWGEPLEGLSAQDFSSLVVEVYAKRTIFKDICIGGFEIPHVLSLPQSEEPVMHILRAFGRQRSRLGTASLDLIITRPSTTPAERNKEPPSPIPVTADAPEGLARLEVSGMPDARAVQKTSPNAVKVPQTSPSSVEDVKPGPGSVGSYTTSADNAPAGVLSEELRQAVDAMHGPRLLESAGSVADTVQATFGGLASFSDTWKPFWEKVGLCVKLADGIAEIHPYARIAWNVLSFIPKTLSAQVERDKNVIGLLNVIDGAYDFVNQAMSLEGRKEALVIRQKTLLADIWKQTTDCAYFIIDYAKDTNFWKRTYKNAVISEVDTRRQAYLDKLEELKKAFLGHGVVTTEITVFRVLDTVEDISNDLKEHDIDSKLDNIPYVGAGFQSDNEGCLPGTRETFLKDVEEWVNDPDSEQRVCVIFGQAGTGKSSIAHEVARRFEQLRRLGSSFCFNRADQTSRRPQRMFSNIARDLAYFDPHFKQALYRTIRDGTYLRHQDDIAWQLENLILQPMKELRVVGPLVLVIDALDESGDEGVREKMLAILANRLASLPTCFRIVITSRAEPDITGIFEASDVLKHIRSLRMDDNGLAASTPIDILTYIRSRRDKSNPQLQTFLNEDRCRKLAEKSEGLFQWASVACKHLTVSVGGLTISDIFENLVAPSTIGTHLDALYKQVLQQHFVMSNPRVESRFKSVIGRILAAFEPLSLSSLAELHPPEDDPEPYDGVKSVVGHLSSLLSGVHDSAMPIRPLHTSFRDFLVNQRYSLEFYINPRDYHSNLAFACLRTLSTHLKFNMCQLETSYALNKDVPNLKQRVQTSIPPFMSYACRFWAQHLQLSRFDDNICHHVRRLLGDKLLFWIEALSLSGEVGTAASSLECVVEWTKGHPAAEEARTMATDAYSFVRLFGACIAQSAPHVYVSALPFTPESSQVFRNYGSHFPRIPRVCTGQAQTWPQTQMTLTGHEKNVQSVAFSSDGKHIVSGSFDKTIRLWSSETGEAIGAPLEGHRRNVTSVAFSPDGKHIVSGSRDRTIRLWSSEMGAAIGAPLEGHREEVTSVAFSSDGRYIASGSWDNTIRLWSLETGEAIGAPLEGDTSGVTSVAFSPDGRYIASGSSDMTVRLWSVETGEAIRAPMDGHTDLVKSIAFSPDGKHIVSGSRDRTVRLWSSETGKAIGASLEGHTGFVTSVAFSPDGNCIVSGSHDNTVRLWSSETGAAIGAPLQGHTNNVASVAFSPNGRHIVSGSWDNTIRLWSSETSEAIGTSLEGHTMRVTSVAFSPDGRHVVSGSYDNTVRLWSSGTGEAIGAPLEGHTTWVTSVAFSSDGKYIASGSYDNTVRLWSSETGETIGAPLEGHTRIVTSVAFSPDGKCIVSGSDDKTIRLWSSETGAAIGEPLEGHTRAVTSVAFSPDGKYIVSGSSDKTICLWCSETGEAIGAPLWGHTNRVTSVVVSPDGRHIASGSEDATVRLWSLETGEAIGTPLEGHTGYVASVAFSRDGRHIVSVSYDRTVRLWSSETGEAIGAPLEGHTNWVTSVAFSPDGKHIVSGSRDRTVRLWNVHNKREGIILSRNPSHALASPEILLGSPSPSQNDPRDLLHRRRDGWLVGPESRLLLWVPAENRQHMHWVCEDFVISQHTTELDLSNFAHGPDWHECYVGEDEVIHGGSEGSF